MMEAHAARTEEERAYYALNKQVYSIFAPFYDLVVLPIRHLRERVASAAHVDSGARVLDVATGTGAQARAFAQVAGDVVGIDISEAMLKIAKRKNPFANLTFRQVDATRLPFDDASFDVACVSFALHEMPRSVRQRVVREMVRVTKPRGRIVVVDYALPENEIARWLVYHTVKLYERDNYAEFVRSDVRALLRDTGVGDPIQEQALGGIASIYIGRRDVQTPIAVRSQGTAGNGISSGV